MQQFVDSLESEQIIESGGGFGDLDTWTRGFRYKCKGHSLPSEIHTLDKMFNTLVFNYNTVS